MESREELIVKLVPILAREMGPASLREWLELAVPPMSDDGIRELIAHRLGYRVDAAWVWTRPAGCEKMAESESV